MRKSVLALVVVLIAVSLVGLVSVYLVPSSGGGHGFGAQSSQASLGERSIWILVAFVPLIVALGLVVYEVLFPKIKIEPKQFPASASSVKPAAETKTTNTAAEPVETPQALSAILRVLNPDEQNVVNILASSGGSMLQRDISWKTGLSRVKTHRVIARLSARGIVKVQKYYNTNKVELADWVRSLPQSNP